MDNVDQTYGVMRDDKGSLIISDQDFSCILSQKGEIIWTHNKDLDAEILKAMKDFQDCVVRINLKMPEGYKQTYYLIASLSFALIIKDKSIRDNPKQYAEIWKAFRRVKFSPTMYCAGGFIACTACALLCCFLEFDVENYLLYGGLGGLTSVLQKASQVGSPIPTWWVSMMQGFFRVIIGGLFGIVSYLLINANLLLGDIGSNVEMLLLVAFIAGLSERLIPDAAAKVEKQLTK